jgi:secreted trypsin-like serine protease
MFFQVHIPDFDLLLIVAIISMFASAMSSVTCHSERTAAGFPVTSRESPLKADERGTSDLENRLQYLPFSQRAKGGEVLLLAFL